MKVFLFVFSVWLISLGAAWLFAPASADYPTSSYWTWIFWIWFVAAGGLIRGFLALGSGPASSEDEFDEEEFFGTNLSLDLDKEIDIKHG
jgi:hypothetical protein